MNKNTFKQEVFDLFHKEIKIDCSRGVTIDISKFTDKLYENYIKGGNNGQN